MNKQEIEKLWINNESFRSAWNGYTFEEALVELNKLEEAALEVDDSEMYETSDLPTESEKYFAKEVKDFIEALFADEVLAENFRDSSRLRDHYHAHCLAKDKNKKSKRSSVYYDFNDIELYRQREKELTMAAGAINNTVVITSLFNTTEVINGFKELFAGNKFLIFDRNCGFTSNDNQLVSIFFHSFADNVTTNYNKSTVDFLMYDRYTRTLFPIDADYVENKFNNLVVKWNSNYNQPFKIKENKERW